MSLRMFVIPGDATGAEDDVNAVEEEPSERDVPMQTFGIGDVVRSPMILEDGSCGPVATLRLVSSGHCGWRAERLCLRGAKVKIREGNRPGWAVEQPSRKPGQWSKWFYVASYGDAAEAEAYKCQREWDAEDAAALLAEERLAGDIDKSGSPLCSLDKARKSDELEVVALLSEHSSEGRTEWSQRQSASKFSSSAKSHGEEGDDVELASGLDEASTSISQ